MGERREGHSQQSHQEFFCRAVVSVVGHVDFRLRIGLSEFWPVSRHFSGTWVGACAVRGGAGGDVWDLHWDVVAVGSSAVLLPAASGKHGVVHLYAFAFDDPHLVERWD